MSLNLIDCGYILLTEVNSIFGAGKHKIDQAEKLERGFFDIHNIAGIAVFLNADRNSWILFLKRTNYR